MLQDMEYYLKVLRALEDYFVDCNWRKLFLEGGCYWFADRLHQGILNSCFMINRQAEHCALFFDGGLYDVTGKIPPLHFRMAGERDICFMKKNYIPHFDVKKLEQYLRTVGV